MNWREMLKKAKAQGRKPDKTPGLGKNFVSMDGIGEGSDLSEGCRLNFQIFMGITGACDSSKHREFDIPDSLINAYIASEGPKWFEKLAKDHPEFFQ
jgi:hypothetical protein